MRRLESSNRSVAAVSALQAACHGLPRHAHHPPHPDPRHPRGYSNNKVAVVWLTELESALGRHQGLGPSRLPSTGYKAPLEPWVDPGPGEFSDPAYPMAMSRGTSSGREKTARRIRSSGRGPPRAVSCTSKEPQPLAIATPQGITMIPPTALITIW